jgi:monoamine oxidase
VLIVGGGAAGLAAADVLARAGRSVIVLEARERIGGRCWTRRMPGLGVPVELGAEFLHGEAKATHALLRRAHLAAVDSVRAQRRLQAGRLRPMNAFAEAARAVRGASLARDVSFDEFLAGRRLPAQTKLFARMMVQGFDAADPRRVSARSIIEEWGAAGSLGASQPRPQGGYGAAFDWLARSLVSRGVRLMLPAAVKSIDWKRGSVRARVDFAGTPRTLSARRAVITLPLGVLQAGAVRFHPALEKNGALGRLASGAVIRVALRFQGEFWRRRAPGVAFFHVPQAAFPTFWTPLPMRAPLLTAWAGGPKAERLTGRSSAALVRDALASVAAVFGARAAELVCAYVHDWAQDPYARGGYSYVLAGGEGARAALAAPLRGTLYFAGEATDADEAGTVAGALRSGVRAARQILDA